MGTFVVLNEYKDKQNHEEISENPAGVHKSNEL